MESLAAVKDQLTGKLNAAQQAMEGAQDKKPEEPMLRLESAEQAAEHRKQRGEEEPLSPRKSGLGKHYDVGGVADFGPVDTERMQQKDERDIQARVP